MAFFLSVWFFGLSVPTVNHNVYDLKLLSEFYNPTVHYSVHPGIARCDYTALGEVASSLSTCGWMTVGM